LLVGLDLALRCKLPPGKVIRYRNIPNPVEPVRLVGAVQGEFDRAVDLESVLVGTVASVGNTRDLKSPASQNPRKIGNWTMDIIHAEPIGEDGAPGGACFGQQVTV